MATNFAAVPSTHDGLTVMARPTFGPEIPEIRCPSCPETIYNLPDRIARHRAKDHDEPCECAYQLPCFLHPKPAPTRTVETPEDPERVVFAICDCGCIEYDIPRATDGAHQQLCPVLNPTACSGPEWFPDENQWMPCAHLGLTCPNDATA